ncbi:unnamed protein product [Chrysoparadoxa australica]
MYISLRWIKSLVNIDLLSLNDIIERLTLAGFEIEEVIEKTNLKKRDIILDISLTANRYDVYNLSNFKDELLSIFGEQNNKINILKLSSSNNFLIQQKLKYLEFNNNIWMQYLKIYQIGKNIEIVSNQVTSNDVPSNLLFLNISETFVPQESPNWIKNYLIHMNIPITNKINDIVNFIMLENGYPFFVYDYNKLCNFINLQIPSTSNHLNKVNLTTRFAETNEIFEVQKNEFRKLTAKNLLILANKKPIALAGIVQHPDTCVDSKTTKIIIQSSLFSSKTIRQSAQSLGLRTESSIRFEKNLTLNNLEKSLNRLFQIFWTQNITFSNFQKLEIHSQFDKNDPDLQIYNKNNSSGINLNYETVRKVLGPTEVSLSLTNEKIIKTLKVLNFKVIKKTDQNCLVFIPIDRQLDIFRQIDIIEEIVRVIGFNKFTSRLTKTKTQGKISKRHFLKTKLKDYLVNLGLTETLHYTLTSNSINNQISLKNPILSDNSSLRFTLLEQLIEKAFNNRKQGQEYFEAFEIGRIYSKNDDFSFVEQECIAGIFGGKGFNSEWINKNTTINWFEAKGLLCEIFLKLDLKIKWSKPNSLPANFYHPGRTANLYHNDIEVGTFGQINRYIELMNNFSSSIYLFELNLDKLEKHWNPKTIFQYTKFSSFPALSIDLAFLVNNQISFAEIEYEIYNMKNEFLESILLFDYYSGKSIPQNSHSLGINLKFRSTTKTLTNPEIEKIISKIKLQLINKFNVMFRI